MTSSGTEGRRLNGPVIRARLIGSCSSLGGAIAEREKISHYWRVISKRASPASTALRELTFPPEATVPAVTWYDGHCQRSMSDASSGGGRPMTYRSRRIRDLCRPIFDVAYFQTTLLTLFLRLCHTEKTCPHGMERTAGYLHIFIHPVG